jgi:hypothetical protein
MRFFLFLKTRVTHAKRSEEWGAVSALAVGGYITHAIGGLSELQVL